MRRPRLSLPVLTTSRGGKDPTGGVDSAPFDSAPLDSSRESHGCPRANP
jgi:hypothetical protein